MSKTCINQTKIPENTFKNPIISGFNPDPSICRVNDEYFLVTSTFAYFPGLPIYKSRDLINWKQIGNVLDRPEQLNLDKADASAGLYAPSIRYNNGVFYVICTNVSHGGNFVVTATNPEGPWSDPYFIGTEGIDPCLFFDDDGKAYYIGQRQKKDKKFDGDCEVYIQEFDPVNIKVTGEPVVVWDGALKNAFWVEGPRLYKMFGYYYLLVAEGATNTYHSVTMARSKAVFGKYESCMRNPIITNRHLGSDYPITNVGHADLVETQNGEWWMVALAYRYVKDYEYPLGRETYLAKIDWDNDLWPLVNKGIGCVPVFTSPLPNLPINPVNEIPKLDTFDYDELPPRWITARTPREKYYSLENGKLRLFSKPSSPSSLEHFSFLAQRVKHKNFTLRTAFEIKNVLKNERAGFVITQKNTHYFEFSASKNEIALTVTDNGKTEVIKTQEITGEKIYLTVEANCGDYDFYYGLCEGEKIPLAKNINSNFLNTIYAVSYTGLVAGIFTSSYGENTAAYADFDYFYYDGND